MKATTKQLKRTRVEGRIRDGDQFGFYKHLKGMDVEGKRGGGEGGMGRRGGGRGRVMPKRLKSGFGHHRLQSCGPSNGRHNIA